MQDTESFSSAACTPLPKTFLLGCSEERVRDSNSLGALAQKPAPSWRRRGGLSGPCTQCGRLPSAVLPGVQWVTRWSAHRTASCGVWTQSKREAGPLCLGGSDGRGRWMEPPGSNWRGSVSRPRSHTPGLCPLTVPPFAARSPRAPRAPCVCRLPGWVQASLCVPENADYRLLFTRNGFSPNVSLRCPDADVTTNLAPVPSRTVTFLVCLNLRES